MASVTRDISMLSEKGKTRFVMIDGRGHDGNRLPCNGIVAILTLSGEADERVIRARRLDVILFMAPLAVERQPGILAPDVATLAFCPRMCAGQAEIGLVMIEQRRFPRCETMARTACVIELTLHMVGEHRSRIVLCMTTPAICR